MGLTKQQKQDRLFEKAIKAKELAQDIRRIDRHVQIESMKALISNFSNNSAYNQGVQDCINLLKTNPN